MSWTDELTIRKEKHTKQADDASNQRKAIYDSFSPMVTGVLTELGIALWGMGLLGSKFKVRKTTNISNDSNWRISNTKDCVVCVTLVAYGMYFQVSCEEHDGREYGKTTMMNSRDVSELALKEAILNACEKLKWSPKTTVRRDGLACPVLRDVIADTFTKVWFRYR